MDCENIFHITFATTTITFGHHITQCDEAGCTCTQDFALLTTDEVEQGRIYEFDPQWNLVAEIV